MEIAVLWTITEEIGRIGPWDEWNDRLTHAVRHTCASPLASL